MAFYAPMLSADKRQLVMMKATTAPETDSSWANVDTGILVTKDEVSSMWAFEHDKVAYDFDASDAAATDPDTVWTNEANAFDEDDGTDATCATNGTSTTNETKGEGTGAPASGDTIGGVSIMVRALNTSSDVLGLLVTTDAGGETLLNTTQALTTDVVDYSFVLTVPSGGWTWAKIQALEVTYWKNSGAGTLTVSRGQAIVTVDSDIYIATQESLTGRIALHVFGTTTDLWTLKNDEVAVIGDHADFDDVPDVIGVTLAVRPSGDVVAVFTVQNSGSSQDELLFNVRSNTSGTISWGTVTTFRTGERAQNPCLMGVIKQGVDIGRPGFSWRAGATPQLKGETINADNTLGGLTTLDSGMDTADLVVAPGVINTRFGTNNGWVPFIDEANDITFAEIEIKRALGAETIHLAVSDVAVEGNGRTAVPFVVACAVISPDNEVFLIYVDDTFQDLWMTSNVADGGGVDCEIIDAITVTRLSANYLASTIGILYLDTTVKYKEVEMTVPALALLSSAEYPDQNYYIGPYSI